MAIRKSNSNSKNENNKTVQSVRKVKDSKPDKISIEDVTNMNEAYNSIINKMTDAIAFHKVILDNGGKPCDYLFLEVNPAFEKLAGLKRKEIIGKTVLEIFPNQQLSLIETYSKVALTGRPIHFEQYSKPLNKNYEVIAYSPMKGYFITIFNEILEHKQIEQELRDSEKRLLKAQKVAHMGFFDWNLKTNEIFLSDEAYRIHGLKKKVGLSTPELVSEAVHPDDKEMVRKALENAIKGIKNYDIDYRIVWSDGSVHWVNAQAQLTRDSEGKPVKLLGTVVDITERKIAEAKTQQERVLLDRLVETAPEAIVVTDNQGKITRVNPEFSRIFGYKTDEAVGKNIDDLVVPPKLRRATLATNDLIKRGEKIIFEAVRSRKDGTLIDVSITGAPININGRQSAVYAIYRDITEQKLKEKELKESEEKFRTVVETTGAGFHILDAKGNVLDANKEYVRLTGYKTLQDIIGRNVLEWTAPYDFKRNKKELKEFFNKGYIGNLEVDYINPDGKIVPVEINASKVGNGNSAKIYGLARDITARRKMQKMLRKTYDYRNLISELNQFLVRCESEEEIYVKICDMLLKLGICNSVWIGLIEKGNFDVKPVAFKGMGEDFFKKLKIRWDNSSLGNGPTGTAIKTKKPVLVEDITTDARFKFMSDDARMRNKISMVSAPLVYEGEVTGVIDIYSDMKGACGKEEVKLLGEIGADIAIGIKSIRRGNDLKIKNKLLEKSVEDIFSVVSKLVETRDPYTAGHERRVSQLATAIAKKLGLPADKTEAIMFAALVHDVGKIGIPAEILAKPSKLTIEEYGLVLGHPQNGYDILKTVSLPWNVAEIILQHHERINGSGYPQSLKSDEILLEAKIIGVADVVEAMSSARPYRPALGINKAIEEISKNRGKLYDRDVVDACIKLFKEDGFKFKE